jgi:hypothetical protein
MKLLTKELQKQFPALRATESKSPEEILIIAKFFHPCAPCTWYATEYDPEERLFYGYADLGDPENAELGYFSLDEMQSIKIMGLGIERDLYYGKHYLSEVIHREEGGEL